MGNVTVTNGKNGNIVVRIGKQIAGFTWEHPGYGWVYAFGKPSQVAYGGISGGNTPLTQEQAIAAITAGVQKAISATNG